MTFARNTLAGLCLLALAACGGSSDTPSSATLTVTPSLGKVLGGDVRVYTLQGTLIAQGFLGTEGSVELDFGTLPAGFVVELIGGEDIWYFDEGIGGYRPLAEGQVLHAVSAGARGSVTVTALTELMYQRARVLAGSGALTAAHITQAENELRALLGISAANSLLDVPEILDNPLDLPSADTWAGQQAGLLAALASLAAAQPAVADDCHADIDCAPLPGFIGLLASDFADGSLDSQADGSALSTPYATADDPAAWLSGALESVAGRYRTSVSAALAQGTTDKLIGDNLAGRHALTCQRTLPAPVTADFTVDVAADGGFSLQAPTGLYRLPAGNSYANIAQAPGYLGIKREGFSVPAGAVALGSGPVSDGLIVITQPSGGINGDIVLHDQVPAAPFVSVLLSSEASRIIVEGEEWSCPAIAASDAVLVKDTERLADWLPDGNYVCEDSGNTAALRIVTASSGTLTVAAQNSTFTSSATGTTLSTGGVTMVSGLLVNDYLSPYSFYRVSSSGWLMNFAASPTTVSLAAYPYALEAQHDPLGYAALPDWGHTHAGDAVHWALFPRQMLWLAVPPDSADQPVTESLTIYRSLLTGFRFFELTTGSMQLRHCQSMMFYGTPVSSPIGTPISDPAPVPDTCWGSSKFC
jgi:hypothetical protein